MLHLFERRTSSMLKTTTCALVLGWAMSSAFVEAADLKVGDRAPAFALPGSDGKTYSLASFKGKQVVVLAWFPKAFTGG
jgi:peroxiredoxin Q/BCP